MKRPIIKDIDHLKKLCQPVVEFLKENGNPYTEVHISTDIISVTSDECGIPLVDN